MGAKTRVAIREAVSILAFIGVALTARAALADHYVVPSGSMEPTVEIGDRVFVNKAAYGVRMPLSTTWLARFDSPAHGDVVVLESPENGIILLKRVVALSGDMVAVRGGRVWLNGEPAADHANLVDRGGPDFGPSQVPPGKLLVLGDHRGNSHDGRMFGWVSEDAVLGRAVAVFDRNGDLTWQPL